MIKLKNKNAEKAVLSYWLGIVAFAALLAVMIVTAVIGVNKVDSFLAMDGNSVYRDYGYFYLFTKLERNETIIITLALVLAVFCLFQGTVRILKYCEYFRKNGGNQQAQILEKEMNSASAEWLERAGTYITDNYLIYFRNGFIAARYDELVWIYQEIKSYNGIKTGVVLKVLLQNGKIYEIGSTPMLSSTKNFKETEEIDFAIIIGKASEKKSDILIGYTKENVAAAGNIIRRAKQSKNF